MRKPFAFVLLLVMLCACSAPPAPLVNSAETPSATVDQFFTSFIAPDEPGAVVLVVKDGEILHQAAYGMAHLARNRPLTTEHAMHIASVGKQMTALAVMLLAQDGLLEIDAAIGRYIPELAHFGDDFTIRRLLTHTAGMPDYEDDLLDDLLERSELPDNDDLIAVLSDWDGPDGAPGDYFEYSNPGYEVLGALIERVSGMPFPDFMEQRIFAPLGMTHTFSLPNPIRRASPLVALSYTDEDGPIEPYPDDELDHLVGSGTIYTTAGDMALYDAALTNGTLLPPSVLAEAFQPVVLNDGTTEPYGFGWELEEWDGTAYVAHSGAWLGFDTDYVRFPDQHFSVLVMLNRSYDYPDEPRIALQVARIYAECVRASAC